jgi:4-amino-4-deoxy-L-arabinose transferase-like glycosyltransferase
MLPLWEGYDEPLHFSFVQYVAAHSTLPQATTPVSREVQASLHLVPLSWEQRLHAIAPPIYTEDSYWQLPQAAREHLQQQLRALPPAWGMQSGTAPAMYEAQQAPLYYWIMAALVRPASEWRLASRVLLVRLLSVLLASLLVPIAWLAAKQFLASDGPALGAVTVIVCMPELMIDISRAGNESLGVVVYSLLTLLLLRAIRPGNARFFLATGIVLGVGLLTKAYFLLAVPAFLLVAVYSAWRNRHVQNGILINGAAGSVAAFLLGIGWYWRNHVLTGTWSGEENNVAAMHSGMIHVLAVAGKVKWLGGITSILVSHIWFGGWSFLKLPKPVYLIFALGIALALIGLGIGLWKDQLRSGGLFVLLGVYGFFWLGLLYDILLVYVATGVSASDGWYMYAVVLPEVLLVTYGLYQLLPKRWRPAILPAMAAAFAAIDLYGTGTLLVPYYTGLIAHLPGSDVVYPISLLKLVHTGRDLVLSRLTANRPEWLAEPVFAVLILLYCLATVLPVVIAFVAASRLHREEKCY